MNDSISYENCPPKKKQENGPNAAKIDENQRNLESLKNVLASPKLPNKPDHFESNSSFEKQEILTEIIAINSHAVFSGNSPIYQKTFNKESKSSVQTGIASSYKQHLNQKPVIESAQKRPNEEIGQLEDIKAKQRKISVKYSPIKQDIFLTLEEVAKGGHKSVKVSRRLVTIDGNVSQEEVDIDVEFQPGVQHDSKFKIEGKGNQHADFLPGDVIFTFKDAPHEIFKRVTVGDLEYTAKVVVDPESKIAKEKIKIPTLENDIITLIFEDEPIDETETEIISGRGLPVGGDPTQRGNLLVRFQIVKEDPKNIQSELSTKTQVKENTVKDKNPNPPVILKTFKEPEHLLVNEHKLQLTLKEIASGCDKQVTISRKRYDFSGKATHREKTYRLKIKPGIQSGTKLKYPQEGDELPNSIFADLVFIISEFPHKHFIRNGADLIYVANVTQNQLKNKETIQIPLIDGETTNIQLTDLDKHLTKNVEGLGLPYHDNPTSRGSILVKLNVFAYQKEPQNIVLLKDGAKKVGSFDNKTPKEPKKLHPQLAPNEQTIYLTLEEILHGCTKVEQVKQKMFDERNKVIKTEEIEVTLNIKPGSIRGTIIVVKEKGNKQFGKSQADVIFTIEEKLHSHFKTKGNDIQYTAKVNLKQAYLGKNIEIPTLEGKLKSHKLSKQTIKETLMKIDNEGLPFLDGPKKRGHLLVTFDFSSDPHILQAPLIKKEIELTLEEILNGVSKQVTFQSQTIHNKEYKKEPKTVTVEVKPGTETDSKVVIYREGNEDFDKLPGDIEITFKEMKHEHFRRNGANIEFTLYVTKDQMENGDKFKIPTLENKTKVLNLEGGIRENFIKSIKRLGLPFANNISKRGDILVHFKELRIRTKDPSLEYPLSLTLENILHGATKTRKITRKRIDSNGKEYTEEKIVEIIVEPGTEEGTKFVYENMGDETINTIPADILFVTQDKPHSLFKRNGSNLEFDLLATNNELKNQDGFDVEIPTLDGNGFQLKVNKSAKFPRKFKGKGLPVKETPNICGILIVNLKIVEETFKELPTHHRELISLEKINSGGFIKCKLLRKVIQSNGELFEDKEVKLTIPNGLQLPKRFLFPRFGTKREGFIPGDAIVVVDQEEHKTFKREKANLIYHLRISKSEASEEFEKEIPLLNSGTKKVQFKNVKNKATKTIRREGLPFENTPNFKGDLIVQIEVFDEQLNPSKHQSNATTKTYAKAVAGENVSPKALKNEPEILDNRSNSTVKKSINEQFKPALPPKVIPLELELEDILNGYVNDYELTIKIFDLNERETNQMIQKLHLKILPGTKTGELLKFKEKGDQYHNQIPADVHFKIVEKPHKHFKRNGANLQYNASIISKQTPAGNQIEVPFLGNGSKLITFQEKITPESEILINGQGLPLANDVTKRGQIIVKFIILDYNSDKMLQSLPKNPPIKIKLWITLENILNGCLKEKIIKRTFDELNGKSTIDFKTFQVVVERGTLPGTEIEYEGDGNRSADKGPGDVVFTVEEIKHQMFRRDGVNIEYTMQISSSEAKQKIIQIPILDGNFHKLENKSKIKSGNFVRIPNLGLPIAKKNHSYGHMIVHFDVISESLFEKGYNYFSKKIGLK